MWRLTLKIREFAVQPLAHEIRHVAERENIRRSIQRHAVIKAQTLAGFDFVEDRLQTRIFDDGLQLHRFTHCAGQKDVRSSKTGRITR